MQKVMLFLFGMVTVCLAGCATHQVPQVVKKDITTNDKVVYEIPTPNVANSNQQGMFSGLTFDISPRMWVEDNYQQQRGPVLSRVSAQELDLTFINAMITTSGPIGSYKKYSFKADTSQVGDSTKVEFTPFREVIQPDTGFIKIKPLPVEGLPEALDLLSNSGSLTFQFEVDSPYGSEAVYANFRRLLKERLFAAQPAEVMGKQFKSAYEIISQNNTLATCYVTVYPYRTGSKVVVYATTKLTPDSKYHVDARKAVEDVKARIAQVVKD